MWARRSPRHEQAIKTGRPTPGVEQALYESCYLEVIKESHPDWDPRVILLQESRSSGGGEYPTGIHDRVAKMLGAAQLKRDHVQRLTESRQPVSAVQCRAEPWRPPWAAAARWRRSSG